MNRSARGAGSAGRLYAYAIGRYLAPVLLFLYLGLGACASQRVHYPDIRETSGSSAYLDSLLASPPPGDPRSHIYTLGPYDRLAIRVWLNEDLSGELTVRGDGSLFLPGAGAVEVTDMTLNEAQQHLEEALERILVEPAVQIEPIEVRSKVFTILGSVRQPGRYPIFKRLSIPEAVALAGGVTFSQGNAAAGSLRRVYLGRGGRTYLLDIHRLLTGDPTGGACWVGPGDVIYVPDLQDSRVFVLGEVVRPGAVETAGTGLDLVAAIASAGGIRPGGQPREVAVIRSEGGRITGYRIDLRGVLHGKEGEAADLRLVPGDVVFVPRTSLGAWNRVVGQISPTLSTFVFGPLSAGRDYFLIRDIIDRP